MRHILLAMTCYAVLAACGQQGAQSPADTAATVTSANGEPEILRTVRSEHVEFGCANRSAAEPQDGYQRSADLNGDGRPDYVLDTHHFSCADAAAPFCGSAGCTVDVVLSKPDGSYDRSPSMSFAQEAVIAQESGAAVLHDGEGGLAYHWRGASMEPTH